MFTHCRIAVLGLAIAFLLAPTGATGASRYQAKNRTRVANGPGSSKETQVVSKHRSPMMLSTNCHSHPGRGITHCHC